tara:strand:- start:16743 stop:17297 length:555 start_codon:yes stop_codon:yes gene_type:complete
MKNMKNPFKVIFALTLCFFISSCGSGLNAGLEAYQSPDGRYGFFYPTGWTRVKVEGGPEIIYHDLINSNETLSLVVSDVKKDIELDQLGTPLEVGQTLIDKVIAPAGSGRAVKLLNANQREDEKHVFYDLEYQLNLNEQPRHELATVVIDRGSLYTFAVGTNEDRWNKVEKLFVNVIQSFNFLI